MCGGGGAAPCTIFDLEGGAYVLVHCLTPVWMQVDVLMHIQCTLGQICAIRFDMHPIVDWPKKEVNFELY